jgi:hypothetical protein
LLLLGMLMCSFSCSLLAWMVVVLCTVFCDNLLFCFVLFSSAGCCWFSDSRFLRSFSCFHIFDSLLIC